MTKPFGFLTVRTGSSRLAAKCLLPFGEGNVLEHVIRRTHHFRLTPVVCTTILAEDDIIEQTAEREGALCHRGSVTDKLVRWLGAARRLGVSEFHTVDVDDPFFDGELGHASLAVLAQGYDAVYPSMETFGGSVGFSLTTDLLERVCAEKTSEDTEMMWYHIEKSPGLKHTVLSVPDARVDNPSVRLTLDYDEDYWMLMTVLRVLGPLASRQEIEDLFLRNPDLTQINLFRNADWKAGQLAKKV